MLIDAVLWPCTALYITVRPTVPGVSRPDKALNSIDDILSEDARLRLRKDLAEISRRRRQGESALANWFPGAYTVGFTSENRAGFEPA